MQGTGDSDVSRNEVTPRTPESRTCILSPWFLFCQAPSRGLLRAFFRRHLRNLHWFLCSCRLHRRPCWLLLILVLFRHFSRLLFPSWRLLLAVRCSALRNGRRFGRLHRRRLWLGRALRQVVLAVRIDLEHQFASRGAVWVTTHFDAQLVQQRTYFRAFVLRNGTFQTRHDSLLEFGIGNNTHGVQRDERPAIQRNRVAA